MAGSSTCLNSVVPEPLSDLHVTNYPNLLPGDGYFTEVGINTSGEAVDWLAALAYAVWLRSPRLISQTCSLVRSRSATSIVTVGPYTSRQGAADLRAVVEALGLDAFHLVGCSMGGLIALEYALAQPAGLRSLVLANTYAGPDAYTRDILESWAAILAAGGMPAVMRQMAPWIFSPAFHEEQADVLAGFIAEMVATPQTAESFAAQLAILHDHDCRARLGEIQTPTLILVAESDVFIRPDLSRRMFERLQNARWASVAGGHAVMWENPAAWNGAIVTFVQDHALSADAARRIT